MGQPAAQQRVQINLLEFPFEQRPHDFVMLADQYLSRHPVAPVIQLRLIASYVKLGCRRMAANEWQRLPPDIKEQTESVYGQIIQINDEVVRIRKPTPRFRRNFEAACRHNPYLAELDWEGVFSELSESLVVRCSDGTWQVRWPGSEQWLDGFRNHRTDAEAVQFPPAMSQTPFPGIIVSPLGHGSLFRRVFELTAEGYVGSTAPLYVLEPDPRVFALTLSLEDLAEQLAHPRVRLFVGADCTQRFEEWLSSEATWPLPERIVCGPAARYRLPGGTEEAVVAVGRKQSALIRSDLAEIDRRYADRDARYWHERLGQKPLRIMALTSRFTTVLQHTLRALLEAYGEMGHETRMVMEAADHQRTCSLQFTRACVEFEPDVILLADATRAGLPPISRNVPVVGWMQDRLPRMMDRSQGRAVGPLDLVVGLFKLEFTGKYDYPARQYYSMPLLADTNRMSQLEADDEQLEAYRCEVSYISHQSQCVEAVRDELLGYLDDRGRRLLNCIYDRIEGVYQNGGAIYYEANCNRLVEEVEEELGIRFDPQIRTEVLWRVWHQLNNAIYRHQVLEWAAEAGVDLRLYGKGWEDHPRLGRFACGALEQDAVPLVCRASRINLQVVPYCSVHHRMLNGMAAGGFFLVRWHPSEEWHRVEVPLWRRVCELGIAEADDAERCDDPELSRLLGQYRSMLQVDSTAPLAGADQVLSCLRIAAEHGFRCRTLHVFPHVEDLMFRNRQQFQTLLSRYLENPDARAEVIQKNQQGLAESFSYRRGARDILEALRGHMGRIKEAGS